MSRHSQVNNSYGNGAESSESGSGTSCQVLAALSLPHLPLEFSGSSCFRPAINLPSEIMSREFKTRRSAMRDLIHAFRYAAGQSEEPGALRTPEYLAIVDLFAKQAPTLFSGDLPLPLVERARTRLSTEKELVEYLTSLKGFEDTEGAGRMRRNFAVAESSEIIILRRELLAACVWRLTLPGQESPLYP